MSSAQLGHVQINDIATTILEKYEVPEDILISEEDSLCRTDQNDLAIFHAVDSRILDDTLLITIRRILLFRPPPGDEVLQLAVAIVRNRLALSSHHNCNSGTTAGSISILQTLSQSARITFIDILADTLQYELMTTTVDQWYLEPVGREWLDDALLFLIALVPPHGHVPDSATSTFHRILQPDTNTGVNQRGSALVADRIVKQVAGRHTSWHWQAAVFACLVDALKASDLSIFRDIVHWSYIDDEDVELDSDTYNRLLEGVRHTPLDESDHIHPEALAVVVQVAIAILYSHIVPPGDTKDTSRSADIHSADSKQLLDFIIDSYTFAEQSLPHIDFTRPRIPDGIGIDRLFAAHFSTPALVHPFLECMWARPTLTSTLGARKLLQNAFDETWKHHLPSRELSPVTCG